MGQMTGHRSLNRDGSNRKAGTGLSAEESIYLPNSVAFPPWHIAGPLVLVLWLL